MLDTEIELHPPPAPFAASFLVFLLTKKTRDFCSMVNFAPHIHASCSRASALAVGTLRS